MPELPEGPLLTKTIQMKKITNYNFFLRGPKFYTLQRRLTINLLGIDKQLQVAK